jgi:hypothetical protein
MLAITHKAKPNKASVCQKRFQIMEARREAARRAFCRMLTKIPGHTAVLKIGDILLLKTCLSLTQKTGEARIR